MITRPNKRIPLGSQGRGLIGSTADFGHRRAAVVAARLWVQFPPALLALARSSAVRAASL